MEELKEKSKVEELKEKSAEGTFVDIDGFIEAAPIMFMAVTLLFATAILFIVSSIKTHTIKKDGDMYTVNAEYTCSYVDEKLRIHDIYKAEGNDAEIQYVMVLADSKDNNVGPTLGKNVTLTVYKLKSDTLCYVGEKRLHDYDFLSDGVFLAMTEGKRAKTE